MIINPYSPEMDNIHHTIKSQASRCIAISSATPKEGVSSIAHSITQRLLLSGSSVILLDMNSSNPSIKRVLTDNENCISRQNLNSPALVKPINEELVFTGLTLKNDKASFVELNKPNVLKELINELKKQFDYIVVDCPSILKHEDRALPCEYIAEACGTLIIVTLAQITTEASLSQAILKLNKAGIEPLGIVLNDKVNPSLKDELERQLDKLRNYLPSVFKRPIEALSRMIERNSFFSIDS